MARYVIGDIQGCYDPLRRLLEAVAFDPADDELWFAGDLVNRGPASLEVLRFLHSLGNGALCVLGNHDLHLLAIAHGVRSPNPKDTLDDVLAAPDRDVLLAWLQRQPLLHEQDGQLLVHAGVPPQWDLATARRLAAEVEAVLRGDSALEFFAAMYGNEPSRWDESLTGTERLRLITNYLTRMRLCTADGRLNLALKGTPDGAPAGYRPWFEHPGRLCANVPIMFGHWAALQGHAAVDNIHPLDTGCVWGGRLRALRLDDGKLFHAPC